MSIRSLDTHLVDLQSQMLQVCLSQAQNNKE